MQQDPLTLDNNRKSQLDSNIKKMLDGGASNDDVMSYASDFKNKFGVKKKDNLEPVASTGTQTSNRGSFPFQTQVNTSVPSVLTDQGKVGYEEQVKDFKPAVQKPISKPKTLSEAVSNDDSYVGALWNQIPGAISDFVGGLSKITGNAAAQIYGKPVELLFDVVNKTSGQNITNPIKDFTSNKNIESVAKIGEEAVNKLRTSASSKKYEQSIQEGFDITNGIGFEDIKAVPVMLSRLVADAGLAIPTGGLSFVAQGYNQGLNEYDDAVKDIPEDLRTDNAREGFAVMYGTINGLADKLGLDFITKSKPVSETVKKFILKEAVKALTKKEVKNITSDVIENTISNIAKSTFNKVKNVGVKTAIGAGVEGFTESIQGGLSDGLKILTNKISDTNVFDVNEIKKNFWKSRINDAAGGVILGGALGGAINSLKSTDSYIAERVAESTTLEQIQLLKEELVNSVDENGNQLLDEEKINILNTAIDKYSEANQKLPAGLGTEKRAKVLQLISERDEIKASREAAIENINNIDDAIKPEAEGDIIIFQNKEQQKNDEIREAVTGNKYKYYQDEDGKFYKKLGEGKAEEISQEYFNLQDQENELKTLNKEQDAIQIETAAISLEKERLEKNILSEKEYLEGINNKRSRFYKFINKVTGTTYDKYLKEQQSKLELLNTDPLAFFNKILAEEIEYGKKYPEDDNYSMYYEQVINDFKIKTKSPPQEDAVQVETAGQVPVLTEAPVGEEVEQGKPQPEAEGVTEEGAKAEEVVKLRSEEQAELNAAIPNADQYKTDGKVDRAKITDVKDLKKFDKIYKKYDKLITPLLPEKVTPEKYIEDLQKTKQSDPEQYWSVDDVSIEDAKNVKLKDLPKIIDAKDLASKIRGLKINLGKGTAQSNIAGLPIALYNSTVEAVALFIEAGSTIAEAIDKAIKKYNLDKVNGFNKSELSKNIQESSKPQKAKSVKDIDVNKIRTQNRPGKRISKGLSVKNVKGEKIVEESDNLSAEYVKENAPDVFINNANILTKYPIVAGIKKFGEIKNIEDAQQVYDIFIRQVADNLKNLTNDYNPEFRDIATLWYDGANMLANKLSSEYNVTPEQAAGIIAAMSPQKDWYMNVRLAELVMLAYKQDAVLTNDMISKQIEIIKIGEKPFLKNISAAKKALQKNRTKENVKKSIDAQEKYNKNKENADKVIELLKKYVGVNINSAPKAIQPYIIRLNSELNNSKDFNILRPDGEVVGVAKTIGGENKKIAWGSYSEIGKAASIYNDGSQENITRSLGEMHKIRNFYNNIIDPMSKDGDVTIDTHAVAAALMQPLSGNSKQVGQNFGTGTSNSGTLGIKGLYYAYLDAYNLAAKELGLLPRQVQSITWEAVRGLFTDTFKRDASKVKKINDIWKNYENGNITIEQTRSDVTESAGGIKDPTWAKSILPESEDGIEQGSVGGGTRVDGPTTVGESSSVRVAAKALRKIKINLGKGTAQSNIAGLPIALYNSVIETIALGLEAGDSLATAIKNAIEKYKLTNVKDFDKDLFISEIEKSLSKPIANLKQAKAKRISFEDINDLIELGVTYIEESVKDLKDITFEEFSTKLQDEYGQDIPENIIRNIFKKSAAAIKLGIRRTPERIGTGDGVSASLKEVANETAALYQKQDYKEIQDRLDSMSEADKNTLVGTLANVTGQLNAEGNVGVLAAIDLINMYEANGDKAGAKRVFDTISKSATAFAQLLRQYGQLKSSTPQGYVSIIEKHMLDKYDVKLTDVQKQAIEKLYNDSKKAIDIEADALNNLVDDLTDVNYKLWGQTTVLLEDANRRLSDYIESLKPATAQILFQKLTSIVQGDLLTLKSLLVNPVSNAAQAGIKLSGNEVANLFDFIINTTLKTGRTKISGFDPLAIRLGGKAFTRGLSKANRMLIKGATATDLAKIDVAGRLKPVEAWKSLYKTLRGKQAFEFVKTIENLAEGTIGVPANLLLRLLPYGDLPRNEQVKVAKLIEIGRNKFGLKGNQLEAFTLKPDPESLTEAELEGDKSTLQESNKVYRTINDLINSIDSKGDDKFVRGLLSGIKFIVRGTQAPFLKTPINYAFKTIRFTNPIIPYSQAVYHMVKAIQSAKNIKNPLLRESAIRKHQSKLTEYLGEAVIAQSIMSAALILIGNGLVTGSAPEEDKYSRERNLMFQSVGPNMINISGLKRLLTGGDPTYKPEDTAIAYNALGILGAQLGISSNTLTKKEKENIREKKFITTEGKPFYEEDKGFYLTSIVDMLANLPASLNYTLNQGFAQGTGTLLASISDNEYSKWSDQMVKTLVTGLAVPNTVYQSFKAGNDYYRDVYTKDQVEEWANIVQERYGNLEGLPIKYDMFGKPIKLTPEGSNPYVYNVLDIFRTQKILQNKNIYYVFDLYKKTGDMSVIPSSVKDIIDEEGGLYTKLTPDQKSELQRIVGEERAKYLNGDRGGSLSLKNYDPTNDSEVYWEKQVKKLKSANKLGLSSGKRRFEKEILNKTKK